MPDWITLLVSVVSVVGAGVTAFATILLWRVTRTLAVETKRMADASAQPHVVATIEPNQWSMLHADLQVQNTGNATAYEVELAFNPPLAEVTAHAEKALPLQSLSVLKPGQGLASYLSEFPPLIDKRFTVTASWKRSPSAKARESHTYVLDLSTLKGVSRLGASNPLIQIAEQVKKAREDWQYVASGSRKVKADIYTASDRLHERRTLERRWRRERTEVEPTIPAAPKSAGTPRRRSKKPPGDTE